MAVIRLVRAVEILDSRGRPTLKVDCTLADGTGASASVPSGASTGTAEALELRDGDTKRYKGLGCRQAASHVRVELNDALASRDFASQPDLDRAMIELDGTANKSRLGANAILGVSIAFARAGAASRGVPLYRHFAEITGALPKLPTLAVNLFSGGKHAGGQVPIQDVLVVPVSARSIDESLSMVYAVYQSAAALAKQKYDARPLVADEGGLAPPFPDVESMFQDTVEAIRAAGFAPGKDVALAIDVAATHFFHDGKYHMGGPPRSSGQMIDQISSWVADFPILSVEDGLAEEDWQSWPALRHALSGKALVMGDDLLCTNPVRIRRAVQTNAANALLLKVNQIGTLTEAAEAYRIARAANWSVTISARSGETEDDWLADLAVGWHGDYIKIGSITRSERLAKYNRLLAIEQELAERGAKGQRDQGTKG
jgi:enolase